MVWLSHWCIVRGVNLLIPHAFYYSVRGVRRDERPPDVGPNSAWWDRFRPYADACRRLCYLNTDCRHVCHVAILGRPNHLPWRPAKVCFEHQRDFNYLEDRHLWQDARVDAGGIHLAGMHYAVLIMEGEPDERARPALDVLTKAGRVLWYSAETHPDEVVRRIDALVPPDVQVLPPAPGLRVRHIIKDGRHCYILFNERATPFERHLRLAAQGPFEQFDVWTGNMTPVDLAKPLAFAGHELKVLVTAE